MKSSDSRLRAVAAYRERNKGKARLPGVLLSDSEAELLEEMAARYGSKKEAIIRGLELLKKHN